MNTCCPAIHDELLPCSFMPPLGSLWWLLTYDLLLTLVILIVIGYVDIGVVRNRVDKISFARNFLIRQLKSPYF
jgi:hypothetical protein